MGGAMNVAPFKYMWWFAGLMFLILIATACVYPLVWMLGSEGTAALGLSQEGPARSHRPRGQAGFRPLPCLQLRGHCGRGCRRWHEPAVAAVRLNSGVTWRASVCVDLVRVAGPAH